MKGILIFAFKEREKEKKVGLGSTKGNLEIIYIIIYKLVLGCSPQKHNRQDIRMEMLNS